MTLFNKHCPQKTHTIHYSEVDWKERSVSSKSLEWLLHTRYNSKHFTCINLSNAQSNPRKCYFNLHFIDEEIKVQKR